SRGRAGLRLLVCTQDRAFTYDRVSLEMLGLALATKHHRDEHGENSDGDDAEREQDGELPRASLPPCEGQPASRPRDGLQREESDECVLPVEDAHRSSVTDRASRRRLRAAPGREEDWASERDEAR